MRGRYVLLRWTPTISAQERAARELAAHLGEGWRTIIDWRGVLLLAPDGATDVVELPQGRGAVIGDIYSQTRPDASIKEESRRSAEAFATERWGGYVAVIIDRGYDVIRVLRSPNGAVPSFHTGSREVQIVFSEAVDIASMLPEIEPDFDFVAAFLEYPRVVLSSTGLKGVDEIAPGEALVFSRTGHCTEVLWSPLRPRDREIKTFDEGVEELRAVGNRLAGVIAARDQPILHRLSGGFDSSIVLGLLKRHTPSEAITCINEFWPDAPEGDERAMAAAAARQANVRLIELAMNPHRIAYERLSLAPLTVKPTLAVLSFADRDTTEAYASVGAGILTSGRGGDHVFHRSRTTSIAADAIRDRASAWLTIAVDTARLSRRSVWGVFGTMLNQGLLRGQPEAQARSSAARLLAERSNSEPEAHPWDALMRRETPARSLRIRHLRDALSYHDRSATTGAMHPFPLLLAQPMVDACLRIAPYIMTAGGSDRSLARAAFAEFAPAMILSRSLKGETTRYFATILDANRTWIGDVLPDGELVRSGLIDRAHVTQLLGVNWGQDGVLADGLYSLIAAEAWLQNLKRFKEKRRSQSVLAA